MSVTLDRREQQAVGDRVLPLVTCPQIYSQKLIGHRYLVKLVSLQVQLQEDRAVPVNTQVIDVVVVEPTQNAVEQLLAATGWLESWQIVSYFKPDALEAPF